MIIAQIHIYIKTFVVLLCLCCLYSQSYSVELYKKFEIDINHTMLAEKSEIDACNPFDKNQIMLIAIFTDSLGNQFQVNGFYYSECEILQDTSRHHQHFPYMPHERIIDKHRTSWKIRFSPQSIGTWTYAVFFVLPQINKKIPYSTGSFACTPALAGNKGFVTLKHNDHLEYSNGEGFIPIGLNINTFPEFGNHGFAPKIYFYDVMFKRLAEHGGTAVRIWFNWTGGQFLIGTNDCIYYYDTLNLKHAFLFDTILQRAEYYGIKLMVNIFAVNDFTQDTRWELNNTYNKHLQQETWCNNPPYAGGPCTTKEEFLTNQDAINHQKNVIRYIIDRWGYSQSIYTWQLCNEADFFPITSVQQHIDWHIDTYKHIKEYDVYQRPVIASFAGGYSDYGQSPNKIKLQHDVFAAMDYVSYHRYTDQFTTKHLSSSLCNAVFDEMQKGKTKFSKPIGIDECGNMDYQIVSYEQKDPHGYAYHQTLWTSIYSGIMGPSFDWQHYAFIKRNNPSHDATAYFKTMQAVSMYLNDVQYLGGKRYTQVRYNTNKLNVYLNYDTISNIVYGYVQDENFRFEHFVVNQENKMLHPYLKEFDVQYKPTLASPNHTFEISHVPMYGTLYILWYDTETGKLIETQQVRPQSTTLQATIPRVLVSSKFGDAAFKIVALQQ